MSLENTTCPICGCNYYATILEAKDFRFRTTEDNFKIAVCKQCGFRFLNPRPKESEIAKYYPPGFNKKSGSPFDKIINDLFNFAQQNAINSIFKKYKKSGKMLDLGCGNGTFLLAMQKNGYEVWGTELNPCAREYVPDLLKERILYKDLVSCNFAEKSFDIITMFQSLEHMFNLKEILENVHKILKDNGILYICVPNMDFFESRLFGKYYYNLEVPRHLYFFTKESLDNLMLNNGFKRVKMLPKSLFELILTPLSFYHSIRYSLSEKFTPFHKVLEPLILLPLFVTRFFLLLVFITERQDLEAIYCLAENENS